MHAQTPSERRVVATADDDLDRERSLATDACGAPEGRCACGTDALNDALSAGR